MKFQRYIQNHQNQITLASAILIAIGFAGKYLLNSIIVYDWAFILASIIAAVPIMIHAYQSLRVKVISIELLVSIAVVGAFIIGEYNESAIVTFLFLFGSYLEQRTLSKTRQSIKSLTQMAPETAILLHDDGAQEEVDIEDVDEGDHIMVKTGASVPVDGNIVSGSGYLDESVITGESKAVAKTTGDSVYSGSILGNGTLTVEATKVGEDTTFGKIIELVEDAQDAKSPAESFIDKFAQYYTPAVLIIAVLVYIFTRDFPTAITVLVLGCPGALVIGAPVSNVAGIGNGAKRGILLKGGAVMDDFAKVDTFVFDKTGTLTLGNTAVSAVKDYADDSNEALALVARAERLSDHPLGKAITDYATHEKVSFEQLDVAGNDTVKGQGLTATIDGHHVLVGNLKMMNANHVALTDAQHSDLTDVQHTGSSVVMVAVDGALKLILGVSDTIRPGIKEQLQALRDHGAKHLVMLTGDNKITAQYVAEQIGLDEVHAELLPEEKVDYIKKFKDQGRHVAFVGDGINDSPAIATAQIGIAMGSGTDVAIETSDVVLMQSSFEALVHAYSLSKKTVINTKENIAIAIGVVIFLLIGLILGFIYMASGMFVHEASILVVIFNAMRLIGYGKMPTQAQKAATQKTSLT
ncbi:heavy metal translocating P-type ATPase [Lactobacillus sp. LC28-10]|uniref:Cd(2+)-exporting ATPase n=1 Tax=Secundilactobacillus angelensis TaxID=2722706 RepID=A0ABX1KU02_9LACO|nr:heavy metal translocating P-type ATPase [Secundilactobacillus angelensis]MCH5461912.1 heavy metal translocating P-type ATPase [Secundilactobacillus angelensis]NLR17399.1 heavy metal translocating P-type ATPase [Secundilactobacillus angelensis]